MKERLTTSRLNKLLGHRVYFGYILPLEGIVACGVLYGFDAKTVTVLERGVKVTEHRAQIGEWEDLDDPENEDADRLWRKAGFADEPVDSIL